MIFLFLERAVFIFYFISDGFPAASSCIPALAPVMAACHRLGPASCAWPIVVNVTRWQRKRATGRQGQRVVTLQQHIYGYGRIASYYFNESCSFKKTLTLLRDFIGWVDIYLYRKGEGGILVRYNSDHLSGLQQTSHLLTQGKCTAQVCKRMLKIEQKKKHRAIERRACSINWMGRWSLGFTLCTEIL